MVNLQRSDPQSGPLIAESAFCNFVAFVVRLGSKPQVIGIAARWDIARMADE
jgi:hypothetical protein